MSFSRSQRFSDFLVSSSVYTLQKENPKENKLWVCRGNQEKLSLKESLVSKIIRCTHFSKISLSALLLLFSRQVVSDSLGPHGPQHAQPPCPSRTPGAYSNSCPSSRWCHPTISSSVAPFSCLQFFQASGSFPVSQLFTSGGQSTGVSASTLVLPVNTQD